MASTKNFVLIGAGVAAVVYAMQRTSILKESLKFFQYDIRDIRLNIKSILNPEVIFTISIFNPNRSPVPIESFFGQIKNGASVLANFNNTSPVTIGGNETATIDVAARISALNVVLNIIQKQSLKTIDVSGIIKTPVIDMPFQKTVTMPSLKGIGAFPKQRFLFGLKSRNKLFFWRKHKKGSTTAPLFQPPRKRKVMPIGVLN